MYGSSWGQRSCRHRRRGVRHSTKARSRSAISCARDNMNATPSTVSWRASNLGAKCPECRREQHAVEASAIRFTSLECRRARAMCPRPCPQPNGQSIRSLQSPILWEISAPRTKWSRRTAAITTFPAIDHLDFGTSSVLVAPSRRNCRPTVMRRQRGTWRQESHLMWITAINGTGPPEVSVPLTSINADVVHLSTKEMLVGSLLRTSWRTVRASRSSVLTRIRPVPAVSGTPPSHRSLEISDHTAFRYFLGRPESQSQFGPQSIAPKQSPSFVSTRCNVGKM